MTVTTWSTPTFRTTAVFDKLGEVEGLTLDQTYQLFNIFGDKSQRLEVFMGMPPHAHLGYVLKLMDE
ncbi:hypothetical protein SASPL_108890 [Salvia splendens]|uniref:Uncharacterized protein n=1 Tax=Salvia splendens TaxID=180675 RepID=A0A8X9A5T2_SALSN|nr:hypothetical protein SASPL_108890 [Salvia splendens]